MPKKKTDTKEEKAEQKKESSLKEVNVTEKQKKDNSSFYAKILLYFAIIGSSIGFLSFTSLPGAFVKTGLLYTGVIATLIILILSGLKKSKFTLPNNLLSYVFPVLPLVYFISALFNDATFTSMIGLGAEIGTVSFVFIMFLLFILSGIVFRKKVDIAIYQFVLAILALVLFAIQAIRIFKPELMNLNESLVSPLSSFLGNLNDLGVFYGAILILSLCVIELSNLNIVRKIFAYALAVVSLVILSLSGFTYLWIIIGLFSLLLFVSIFSFSTSFFPQIKTNSKLSYTSLAVVLLSAVFIIFGSTISMEIRNQLGVSNNNQSYPPSIENTLPVIKSVISESPVLGVGPNRFDSVWVKEKPLSVNNTQFWNIDYKYGNSFVLTLIANTGIAGLLAWLVLLGVLIYTGVKYLFVKDIKSGISSYLTYSSFVLAVYLWLSLLIYVPSPGMMAITFMSTGIFISSLYAAGLMKNREYAFNQKPAISFVSVMVMVLVLIGAVAYEYTVLSKVYAANNYNKATTALANNNFSDAKKYIQKSISFGGNDIYYRGLSDILKKELNVRAVELTSDPTESQRQESVDLFTTANNAALSAVNANKTNYQNYVAVASVHELLASTETMNVYENAKTYYKEAIRLNPTDPSLRLSLANLERIVGNRENAREYINEALQLKPNYVSAYVMLSQIQENEGNTAGAIKTLESAVTFSPNDIGLLLELGKARYNNADYSQSKSIFENILRLASGNGDAKYFLALSLDRLGQEREALRHLMELKQSNPNNRLIEDAISNIQSVPEAPSSDDEGEE